MAAEPKPAPLVPFHGEKPPAPAWFDEAIAVQPERSSHQGAGVTIETLAWGERGKPGLLMLHGGSAHADWWSYLAPFFAKTHRVVASSWSGMGGSDWRDAYSMDLLCAEMLSTLDATGLDEGPVKPVVVSHSFGSFPAMAFAARFGERIGGLITVDSPFLSNEMRAKREIDRPPSRPPRDTVLYDSFVDALARFRLMPAQAAENLYIVDYIARHSLREVAKPDGSSGWTWRFDPFMWSRLKRNDSSVDLAGAKCRLAITWGSDSVLFPDEIKAFVRATAPKGTMFIEIPKARHHVLIDQPLALVTLIRSVIAGWDAAAP
ncbi:MAG: alpha/beta hydrolase [Phreatobacter sp.]|uniref:alpha/beta fold hydrolase n=1 Tax=Phreatobacter sp. TaxID=1966341 RepID=UPI001A625A85|nr:alpha/beta hydrolase [Phreatobacter sp.]MBL8569097.1 alpha/beta hydrolase [Phreatobacter sp.]